MSRRLLFACALVASGCSGVQNVFNPAGPAAAKIASLTWWFFGVCGVVYVLVMAATTWAIMRRRAASDDSVETEHRLGVIVAGATAVTALTLVGLTAATVVTGRGLQKPSGPGAVTIDAIGHQWWWDFQYRDVSPNEIVSSPNELHIPVGVPVVINTASRDVIHSFWVPNLHGKRDLIPGMETAFWIQADRPGTYRGQCAEFCGHQHANMAFLVVAEPMGTFRAWLQQQRRSAPEPQTREQQRGRDVFLQGPCVMCHAIRGTSAAARTGPDLTHVASRQTIAAGVLPNTRGHRAGWIADPQAIKPGNRMPPNPISGSDLQALLAYVETLR